MSDCIGRQSGVAAFVPGRGQFWESTTASNDKLHCAVNLACLDVIPGLDPGGVVRSAAIG
jgi:hypothetical protein